MTLATATVSNNKSTRAGRMSIVVVAYIMNFKVSVHNKRHEKHVCSTGTTGERVERFLFSVKVR